MHQKTGFSARIEFVTMPKYHSLINKLRDMQGKNTLNETRLIGMNELSDFCNNGDTGALSTCTGGCVQDGFASVFFHFSRLPFFKKREVEFKEQIKILNKFGKLKGLIAGGEFYDISGDCFKGILKTFENFKINPIILWGHDAGSFHGTNVSYLQKKDTFYVATTTRSWDRGSHVKSIKELKDFYNCIHIPEGNKVIIGGKQVPLEKINNIENPFDTKYLDSL